MSQQLRLALAQINTTVGDFEGNYRKVCEWIQRAADHGSHIVAFPELTLCGYPPEDLLFKPHFLAANRSYLSRLFPCCREIMAVVGLADSKNEKVFNAAAIIVNGKLIGTYHKAVLPNYGVFDEKRYFAAGDACPIIELNGCPIGITICEDIWDAYGPARRQVGEGGARVLINISASPYHQGKLHQRRRMLQRRARSYGCTVCYVNLVGGQDELVFDGGSMVCAPDGTLLAQGPEFTEGLIVTDLPGNGGVAENEGLKTSGDTKRHRSCSCIFLRADVQPCGGTAPPVTEPQITPLPRIEGLYRALVLGTRDYVRKNNFTHVVLGLSGGIDSALTAAIACDALGPVNVTGISMPSRFSSEATQEDARRVAVNLDFKLITLPIETIFHAYLDTLREIFKNHAADVTEENIQARIRGNLLMALSNKFGWLVLTTGNKSEISCGYCTLYGDMAGGFAVIKDVPKMTVYKLARYRNRLAKQDLIPGSILRRAPSAELREDQRDEDSLPQYSILDSILNLYVEHDASANAISGCGFNPAVVAKVIRLVDQNEYKRRQAPPGIRITPKAFGRDRRMPITNQFCDKPGGDSAGNSARHNEP